MSAPTAPAAPFVEQQAPRDRRATVRAGALDALVVALWFAVAGLVGALVWWQLTPLPEVVRTGDGATLAPGELVKQVDIDGWFFVVAAVGGVLSGAVLLAWRRRDPLLMVVLVVVGAGLAAWLMVHLGLSLGPDQKLTALRDLPEGASVSMQLELHAPGMAWIWPIGAALGALIQVWVLRKPGEDH